MVTLSPSDKVRLTTLRNKGVIKGYQEAGGPNYGISADPLPFLIFPITEGSAHVFYDNDQLRASLELMEEYGPLRPGDQPLADCVVCGRERHHA